MGKRGGEREGRGQQATAIPGRGQNRIVFCFLFLISYFLFHFLCYFSPQQFRFSFSPSFSCGTLFFHPVQLIVSDVKEERV
jgi:hypothetical protein